MYVRYSREERQEDGAVWVRAEVDAVTGKVKSLNVDVRRFPEL